VTAIDVGRLLGELAEQRRDRAGISTTALNLVAFVEGDEQLLHTMTERLDMLAERNVSRTLLLACEECEHLVRSHSTEIGDTLVTHSEQIRLAVKDVDAAELRSIVHDLLVPNVRTVLLWGGVHVADPRFSALAELAETIVLFTSAKDGGTASLRELLRLQGTHAEHKIRDLAFLRLLPWQDMIAQFFDDPELAAELPHLARVEVVTGSAPEAFYLAGWLASRLSWDACGKYEFCNVDGGTIKVGVRQDGLPRRVHSVYLHSANSVFGASTQKDAEDLICLTVEGAKQRPRRCVPLHDVDMLSLVERAIFMPRSDVYAQTLHMVERLLEHER